MDRYNQQNQDNKHTSNNTTYDANKIALMIFCVIISFLIVGWILEITWNYSLPAIFGTNRINYGQSLAILILANILLGTIGHACIAASR